jgi:hypothetical protein
VTDRTQVVVGGTVAALTAADAIAAEGRPVRLYLPRRGVGGGFLPLERGGRRLDLGMRVLELHYEGTGSPPPVEDYRADDEGHRPFVALVDAWVRGLVGGDAVVPVDTPASYLHGRLGPELLLSSDLSGAAGLAGEEDARRMAAEAADAARRSGDAGWLAADQRGRLAQVSFDEASLHQHGRRFHDVFLDPFIRKVRPAGGSDVVAALRRKVWVPLFWPRTVAEALGGLPVGFVPERPLTVVRPGGMGAVVSALVDRLGTRGVEVIRYDRVGAVASHDAGVQIAFDDGSAVVAQRPVLGLSAGDLFRAAGIGLSTDRVRTVMAWVGVREDDVLARPGFVHVLDAAVPAYRVTPGERDAAGSWVFCVELAHDVRAEQAAATAAGVLRTLGLVREHAATEDLGVLAGPTFTAPTADNLRRHTVALGRWHELGLPALVVAGAQAPFADSFNEQVVQGLQVAASAA